MSNRENLSRHITARRISGDCYDITSPHTSLSERGTWSYLCRLAQSHGATRVDVLNAVCGDGELDKIEYRPSDLVPLTSMVRPSMASSPVIATAE